MMQITEQTNEEKIKMYMKCTKKELIEMLIESNKFLDVLSPIILTECIHKFVWHTDYNYNGGGYFYCEKCTKRSVDTSSSASTSDRRIYFH